MRLNEKKNLFVILGFKRTQIKSAKMWIWPGNIPSAVVGHLLKIKVDDEIWFRQLTQFSFFVVVDSHFVCVRIEECRQKVLSFLKERKKWAIEWSCGKDGTLTKENNVKFDPNYELISTWDSQTCESAHRKKMFTCRREWKELQRIIVVECGCYSNLKRLSFD